MPDRKLTVILQGKDNLSKALKTNSAALKDFAKKTAQVTAVLGAAAIAFGAVAVKAASKFEKSMANVSTLVDTTTESMEDMKKEVLDMGGRVGVPLEDLTESLFGVRSAGIDAADAMTVLEESARLGVAGLGSTSEATDILTSAMNSFGFAGEDAKEAADILFKTTKAGKTTISELAQSFGMVAGVAKANGVEFKELQAATAALTTTGLKARVAQTQLRAAILAIAAPTSEMSKALKELGFESGKSAIEQDGLVGVMQKLNEATDGDTEALKKMFGSVEALGAAIALTGEQNEAFISTMVSMNNGVIEVDKAFQKQNATFDQQSQILSNELNVIMIKLGSEILPLVTEAVITMSKWINDNEEKIKTWIDHLTTAILWIKDVALAVFAALGWAFDVVSDSIAFTLTMWRRFFEFVEVGIKKLDDFVRPILDGISGAIGKVSDALSFVGSTAKGAFEGAKSFVSDVGAGIGGAVGFAKGGIVSQNQVVRVAEGNKPEAIVPLSGGRSIPVEIKQAAANMGGGSRTINVNFGNVEIRNREDFDELENRIMKGIARVIDLDNLGVAT